PRLMLEGSAQGLPLSALIPDMDGALGANFSVSRPAREEPMTLDVTGRAERIAGAPEVIADALGEAADLRLEGRLDHGVLTVERATLDAPRLRVGAQGTLSGDDGYALDLEAAMQGPAPLPGGIELAGE